MPGIGLAQAPGELLFIGRRDWLLFFFSSLPLIPICVRRQIGGRVLARAKV